METVGERRDKARELRDLGRAAAAQERIADALELIALDGRRLRGHGAGDRCAELQGRIANRKGD